jgi:hypothetical protein
VSGRGRSAPVDESGEPVPHPGAAASGSG